MAIKWLSLLLLLTALGAEAQTINANSCSASDVQAAFNAVTSSTTTISIPAGTCHWTSQAILNVPAASTSLSVVGAGSCTGNGTVSSPVSCNDATLIVDDDTNDSNYLIQLNTNSNPASHFTLSNLSVGGGSGGPQYNGAIAINGKSQNVRVTQFHMIGQTFTRAQFPIIRFCNWLYGVVDHSLFEGPQAAGLQVWMDQYNNDAGGYGDQSWAAPPNFGSNGFLFVENNTFNLTSGSSGGGYYYSDCYAGGRLVTRYNTFNSIGLLVHPTGGAGRIRGCRAMEIYNNVFQGSTNNYTLFFDSSGTALVWGNSITSNFSNFFAFHNDRADNGVYTQGATPNGWGYCGTVSGLGGDSSSWDQTPGTTYGYACLDQVGRGQGVLLQNGFPSTVASGSIQWPSQASEPVYEWMDAYAGPTYASMYPVGNGAIQNNRDYYLWCNASSTSGCKSFNGSAGVGSGTLSARPSTCTTNVAYWATDTSTLYQCASTNTWTTYYTPFTYPHPLDTNSSIAPPTGLSVIVN